MSVKKPVIFANAVRRYAGCFAEIARHVRADFMSALWLLLRACGKRYLIVRSAQGVFRVSTGDRAIGYSLFARGEFEYQFSLKALNFLRERGFARPERATLVDAGANIGVIGIGLLRRGLVARVAAFEPEPSNYDLLESNAVRNEVYGRITCVKCALGDRIGHTLMELSPDNPGDHRIRGSDGLTRDKFYQEDGRRTVPVGMTTLDTASGLLPMPDPVLWIDVQGYEGYVFKGARKFLADGVPTVSEIWPYGILRAGMTLEEFTRIVSSIWTDYWVLRGDRFIRYPISVFDRYLDELGTGDNHGDIIFTRGAWGPWLVLPNNEIERTNP